MTLSTLPVTEPTGEAAGVVGGIDQAGAILARARQVAAEIKDDFRRHASALGALEASAQGMGLDGKARVMQSTQSAQEVLASGEADLTASMIELGVALQQAVTEFQKHLLDVEVRATTGQMPHDSALDGR